MGLRGRGQTLCFGVTSPYEDECNCKAAAAGSSDRRPMMRLCPTTAGVRPISHVPVAVAVEWHFSFIGNITQNLSSFQTACHTICSCDYKKRNRNENSLFYYQPVIPVDIKISVIYARTSRDLCCRLLTWLTRCCSQR